MSLQWSLLKHGQRRLKGNRNVETLVGIGRLELNRKVKVGQGMESEINYLYENQRIRKRTGGNRTARLWTISRCDCCTTSCSLWRILYTTHSQSLSSKTSMPIPFKPRLIPDFIIRILLIWPTHLTIHYWNRVPHWPLLSVNLTILEFFSLYFVWDTSRDSFLDDVFALVIIPPRQSI